MTETERIKKMEIGVRLGKALAGIVDTVAVQGRTEDLESLEQHLFNWFTQWENLNKFRKVGTN